MNNKSLDYSLEIISKIIVTSTKVGVLLGGTIIFLYLFKIDYVPQGVTAGDTFSVLLVGVVFGFLYLFYLFLLIFFGMFLIRIFKILWHPLIFKYLKINKNNIDKALFLYEYDNFLSITSLFGVTVILFTLFHNKILSNNFESYMSVLLQFTLSLFLYLFFSINISSFRAINIIRNSNNGYESKNFKSLNHYENLQKLSLTACLLVPIFASGNELFLESTIKTSLIKHTKHEIYIKESYAQILPINLVDSTNHKLRDYRFVNNVKIVFTGFGDKTVIQFEDANLIKRLAIPNGDLIVIKISK